MQDSPSNETLFSNPYVGLAVMEVQTLHFGHVALLSWMLASCGRCIVALGSSNQGGQPGHPFTFSQRQAMIEGVFGKGLFTFVSLNDIDSTEPEDWTDYVDARLSAMRLPSPTDYFCGSRHDARWYEHAYAKVTDAGTRQGPGEFWFDHNTGRRMRILNREAGDQPSARQIRELLELRDPEWRRYVPPVLWQYVDWHYPPGLRVALRGATEPGHDSHPVGTLYKPPGADAQVVALRDDGKWRPLRTRPDEKADYARTRAAARPRD